MRSLQIFVNGADAGSSYECKFKVEVDWDDTGGDFSLRELVNYNLAKGTWLDRTCHEWNPAQFNYGIQLNVRLPFKKNVRFRLKNTNASGGLGTAFDVAIDYTLL